MKRHRSTGEHLDPDDLPGSQLPGATGETDPAVIDDPDAEELTNADQSVDSTPDEGDPDDVEIDDESQLDEAERRADGAASEEPAPIVRKHSTSPVRKPAKTGPQATKRAKAKEGHRRAGPIAFTKQSVGELKRVVWPTGEQTGQYFVVVLVFVLFIMAFVAGLDFGLTRLLLWLFG